MPPDVLIIAATPGSSFEELLLEPEPFLYGLRQLSRSCQISKFSIQKFRKVSCIAQKSRLKLPIDAPGVKKVVAPPPTTKAALRPLRTARSITLVFERSHVILSGFVTSQISLVWAILEVLK